MVTIFPVWTTRDGIEYNTSNAGVILISFAGFFGVLFAGIGLWKK